MFFFFCVREIIHPILMIIINSQFIKSILAFNEYLGNYGVFFSLNLRVNYFFLGLYLDYFFNFFFFKVDCFDIKSTVYL